MDDQRPEDPNTPSEAAGNDQEIERLPKTAEAIAAAQPHTGRSEQFSLASVFLLTLAVAILAAALRTGWTIEDRPGEIAERLVPPIVAGVLLGFWIGFLIRFLRGHSAGGIARGSLIGAITGGAGGAVLTAPHALWTLLAGSVLMIVFAIVIRRLSQDKA